MVCLVDGLCISPYFSIGQTLFVLSCYPICYRSIFTHFHCNDKCMHLAKFLCEFPICTVLYMLWTYFVHGSYDSVAAFDGNETVDWDDLIKIFCGAVKQVIFKFSPTASLSVTRMELTIRVPAGALSKTSASYGTFTKKKNKKRIQFIIQHLNLNVKFKIWLPKAGKIGWNAEISFIPLSHTRNYGK